MSTTDKSKLKNKVDTMIDSDNAVDVDVTIVDAVFLLHTMGCSQ